MKNIKNYDLDGATSLYPAATKAISLLKDESNNYNTSVILMTDGYSNRGSFKELKDYYKKNKLDTPIYSITFGSAEESQLEEIAELSNARVFDGKTDLLKAFKKVRRYN